MYTLCGHKSGHKSKMQILQILNMGEGGNYISRLNTCFYLGISSLSQSPTGSDTETEPGRGGNIAALQVRMKAQRIRIRLC